MEGLALSYLVDTHAIIWLVENDPRVGQKTRIIADTTPAKQLAIADISLLEISILWHKGRIPEGQPLHILLKGIEANFQVLPINAAIAATAYELPLPQSDPFDRSIVATALYHKLPLITRDRHITASDCVQTIW
ncbi:MAG: type II toxin-antitoxin system VapC family toxin [Opitutales bacterium]